MKNHLILWVSAHTSGVFMASKGSCEEERSGEPGMDLVLLNYQEEKVHLKPKQ